MVFFLALRNITRNLKSSAIVALLIGIITFLFFVGNSITGQAGRSIREAYIESLTGDIVLQRAGDVTMNLFGANTPVPDVSFVVPVLPAFDLVREIAAGMPGVLGITSQVSGRAVIDLPGLREGVLLSGVDAETYFDLMPGIVLEHGDFLRPGEGGAMITLDRALRIAEQTGELPEPGTPVLLTYYSGSGFRIREVPLTGIFSYRNPGQFMDSIVITDPQTVRALNAIQVAGAAEVADDALSLLGTDFDDLFGGSGSFGAEEAEGEFSADFLQGFLSGDSVGADEAVLAGQETGGDWNFIIVRLEKGRSATAFLAEINRRLAPFEVMAVNWRVASGISSLLMLLLQALYNAGIFLVSIAGIITTINILLISVFRRTREIGTLRAIGASDGYIRSLIFCENVLIALVAGLVGIAFGMLFFHWVNGLDLNISNELLASALGGSHLRIAFMPEFALLSFVVALLLAFLASAYPVQAAVRIQPIAAVRQG